MSLNGPDHSEASLSGSQNGADHASPNDARSPTGNVLKHLGNTLRQTKDGNEPKKRGPKPDSKPALTRRQELNRQAQRTHRERKEQYTKALETEVLRLRELYGDAVRERDGANSELNRVRELLRAHGISTDLASPSHTHNTAQTSYSGSNGGSVNGSRRQDTSATNMTSPSSVNSAARTPPQTYMVHQPRSAHQLDLNQIGIDFVLNLERPCMEHMQYLVVRSHNAEGQPFHHPMERADDLQHDHMCGHALMATCPPMSHVMGKPGDQYPHQMPMLPPADLMRLFEASGRLPTDGGEVTPVRAWMMILQSDRLPYMDKKDFEAIQIYLSDKVRCYGFGAVLEEFEVLDALQNVFETRDMVMALESMDQDMHMAPATEVMV